MKDVLYPFEHKLIPSAFYQKQDGFIKAVLSNKELLYQILNDMFVENEIENPYTPEDVSISVIKLPDTLFVLKITYPEPEEVPLCYCSYIFFTPEFNHLAYFCVEKGEGHAFLCHWTQEESHENFGEVDLDEQAQILQCLNIYLEMREKELEE